MKGREVKRKARQLITETTAHSGIYFYFGNIMKASCPLTGQEAFPFQRNPRNPHQ